MHQICVSKTEVFAIRKERLAAACSVRTFHGTGHVEGSRRDLRATEAEQSGFPGRASLNHKACSGTLSGALASCARSMHNEPWEVRAPDRVNRGDQRSCAGHLFVTTAITRWACPHSSTMCVPHARRVVRRSSGPSARMEMRGFTQDRGRSRSPRRGWHWPSSPQRPSAPSNANFHPRPPDQWPPQTAVEFPPA